MKTKLFRPLIVILILLNHALLTMRSSASGFGLVVREAIYLNGDNLVSDSFDSTNPQYSTNGLYDPLKTKSGGDIAVKQGITNYLNFGNATIFGHLFTGSNTSVSLGTNGGVGSQNWLATNLTGIQPGWLISNASFVYPEISLPYNSGFVPGPGSVVSSNIAGYQTNYYDHVLYSGNYYASSLSGRTIVLGDAMLVLPNGFNMGNSDSFTVLPNAHVQIFSGGASNNIKGNQIVNAGGGAAQFVLYCASSVTSLSCSLNAQFTGVIVAPSADFTFNGGGKDVADFVGSFLFKSMNLNGHFGLHYDESLNNNLPLLPLITAQPQSVSALSGQNAGFAVSATGFPALSYQWFFNGTNLLLNTTNATLVLTNITAGNAGAYSVVVSNLVGSVASSGAILSVYDSAAATLISFPNVVPGDGFGFQLSGVPGFDYVIQSSSNLIDWVSVATNTAPFSFQYTNMTESSSRFFRSLYR